MKIIVVVCHLKFYVKLQHSFVRFPKKKKRKRCSKFLFFFCLMTTTYSWTPSSPGCGVYTIGNYGHSSSVATTINQYVASNFSSNCLINKTATIHTDCTAMIFHVYPIGTFCASTVKTWFVSTGKLLSQCRDDHSITFVGDSMLMDIVPFHGTIPSDCGGNITLPVYSAAILDSNTFCMLLATTTWETELFDWTCQCTLRKIGGVGLNGLLSESKISTAVLLHRDFNLTLMFKMLDARQKRLIQLHKLIDMVHVNMLMFDDVHFVYENFIGNEHWKTGVIDIRTGCVLTEDIHRPVPGISSFDQKTARYQGSLFRFIGLTTPCFPMTFRLDFSRLDWEWIPTRKKKAITV